MIPFYKRALEKTAGNIDNIIDFILASVNEKNISLGSKRTYIDLLSKFSVYHKNKPFKRITREDILAFLNSFRKSEELDPLHKWIGTYNFYKVQLENFFKWLYNPDLEHQNRPKPKCIENIPRLKRKEKSIYKPSDLWTVDDDLLFLKYCPFKRDSCYHAISKDSSCRPHELLKLRVKDVLFKMAGDRQYAEIVVNGKTGQRHIPLINSIPYLKDWLDSHPLKNVPNASLICSIGKTPGRKIRSASVGELYTRNKKFFEKLLGNPTVLPEDKVKIKELLKKPWNPYVRRHSALTEKSKILKENILRAHAGWSINSNMHQRYVHYLGNESSESLLEAYGLKPKLEQIDKLKPKQCPNCNESNKVDSKFCAKCRMILSFDGYMETVEENAKKESEVKTLSEKYDKDMKDLREQMEHRFNQILQKIDVKKLD